MHHAHTHHAHHAPYTTHPLPAHPTPRTRFLPCTLCTQHPAPYTSYSQKDSLPSNSTCYYQENSSCYCQENSTCYYQENSSSGSGSSNHSMNGNDATIHPTHAAP